MKIANQLEQNIIDDFKTLDTSNPDLCNNFFHKYGIGNNPVQADYSLERLEYYESLLTKLLNYDSDKYAACHKGTPYYFLGWLCFDLGHFSRAYFYFDLAVYEDKWHLHSSNEPDAWMEDPGAEIPLVKETGKGIAFRVRKMNYEIVKRNIDRFSTDSRFVLDINTLRDRFLKKVMQTSLSPKCRKNFRPIICSLLSYLMLYEMRVSDLRLRALQNGSVEPFLNHLFLGCLVFESLMKTKYGGSGRKTLGDYINEALRKKDLGIQKKIYRSRSYSFQEVIKDMKQFEKKGNFAEVSISITYLLRNTTGHSLSWPDKFDEETYEALFNYICNAIFWLISKKFISR